MTYKKITLTQLSTNKTKLNDFISLLTNENNSEEILVDDLKVGKKIIALAPEIFWFSEFINAQIYFKIKALYPQLFWFAEPINGERSYITIEKNLIQDNTEYPSFTIGDIATGKSLFEVAVITNGECILWCFTIYDKDGNMDYEVQGIKNMLLFTFEINDENKNRHLRVKHFYLKDDSLTV